MISADLLKRVPKRYHNDPTLQEIDDRAYVQQRNPAGELLWVQEWALAEGQLKSEDRSCCGGAHQLTKKVPPGTETHPLLKCVSVQARPTDPKSVQSSPSYDQMVKSANEAGNARVLEAVRSLGRAIVPAEEGTQPDATEVQQTQGLVANYVIGLVNEAPTPKEQ
jgi:hypothetical protein